MSLLRLSLPFFGLVSAVPLQAQELFRHDFEDLVLFDADGDPLTTGDQVLFNGQVGLDLEPEICSSLVPGSTCAHALELGSELVGIASFQVSAEVDASFQELIVTDLGIAPVPVATFPTALGDLTVSMHFLAAVFASGSFEAGASFDVGVEVPFEAGFSAAPGFDFEATLPPPPDWMASSPEFTGAIASSATVGAFSVVEFQLSLSGAPLPSPSFLFGPTAQLSVDPAGDPWWRLDGNVGLFGMWGQQPTVQLGGPYPLASAPIGSLDAGGPFGQAGEAPERWAEVADFGGNERVAFLLPDPNDAERTLVGLESPMGILEVDADGAISNSWSWVGPLPTDGVPSSSGTWIAGAIGSDTWIAEYFGNGSFGVSHRIELFEGVTQRFFRPERALPLPGGDVLLGGEISVAGNENRRTLVRIDTLGEVVWAHLFGPGYLGDSFADMVLTADGAVAICGRNEVPGGGSDGLTVTKIDFDGNVIWTSLVPDLGWLIRSAGAIESSSDGDLVVAGWRALGPGITDPRFSVFTRSFDLATGDSNVERFHGYEENGIALLANSVIDRIHDIAKVPGGFALVGEGGLAGLLDAWLIRMGEGLSLADCSVTSTLGAGAYERLRRVRSLPNGDLLAAGYTRGLAGATNQDLLLVKASAHPLVELDPSSGGSATLYGFSPDKNLQPAVVGGALYVALTATATDYAVPSLAPLAAPTVTTISE